MVLERGMMVSFALKVMFLWDFSHVVTVSNCSNAFSLGKLNQRIPNLSLAA